MKDLSIKDWFQEDLHLAISQVMEEHQLEVFPQFDDLVITFGNKIYSKSFQFEELSDEDEEETEEETFEGY